MTTQTANSRNGLLSAVAACVLACAALACAFVAPTRAQAADILCHSVDESGQVTNYYTIIEAFDAGYSGKTLYMDKDWEVQDLRVDAGQKLTIDMSGHKIACTDVDAKAVIRVKEGAELTLTSTKTKDFWYWHYTDDGTGYTLNTTGGLVTHGDDTGDQIKFTGVELAEKATLNLDNVSISGCFAADKGNDGHVGGGVTMYRDSTLNMSNNATIEGNASRVHGAGVFVAGSDTTITMNNSSICGNRADQRGGGIGIDGYRTNITMNNGSRIFNNTARAGGGVFAFSARFTLKSDDGTAVIERNVASSSSKMSPKWEQSGGGIHVTDTFDDAPSALIENITITRNHSFYDGGGVELDYKGITLRNCRITNNTCKYEGGGVYVCSNGDTLDGCTVTGNACSVNSGGNYEGGGVFVWHTYDINLSGVCVIKGNTRGTDSGNADDVFLREDFWTSTKAYITGTLAEGSAVGVRCGYEKDRRIAKNFSSRNNDGLFIDLSGYYVSYGTDEGGDAWQRHTTREFAVKINGEAGARFKNGATATVVAPAFKGGRIFWRWDKDTTYGLNPIDDYLPDSALYGNVLTFTMPQNDVGLGAYYTTRAEAAKVLVDAPVAGRALPASAKVRRDDDGIGGYGWATAPVTWYEVDEETGTKTLAGGAAKPGTVYAAAVACASDPGIPLYFEQSITWGDVRVASSDSDKGSYPLTASVDPATGALTVVTNNFDATAGEKPGAEAADGAITVKTVDGGIAAGVGAGSAQAEAALAAALSDEAAAQDAGDSLAEPVKVAFASGSEDVAVAAPAVEGYNFCNWAGVPEGVEYRDTDGYVTIPASKLTDGLELTAVYTPAVTEAEVGMAAPAAGVGLAGSVSSLVLTGSDGSRLDLVKDVAGKDCPVTWSPEVAGEDAEAGFSTAYTALIELACADGLEGVEQVLAQGAVVKASDGTEATAAGFTVKDGKLCLAVTFPATRDAKALSVSRPADVELTFEQANECLSDGDWLLPKTVEVTLENGETAEGDVEWEAVEGFDANATAAQELQVKGTITHIACVDGVDDSGISKSVAVTIKIAAPASGDSGKKDESEIKDETKNNDAPKTGGSASQAKSAAKKGVPATGDNAAEPVALLALTGAACLAATAAVVRFRRAK